MALPHEGSQSATESPMFFWHKEEGRNQDAGPAKSEIKAGKSKTDPMPDTVIGRLLTH